MNDKNQMDSTNVATRGSLVKVAFGSTPVVKRLIILAATKRPHTGGNLPFVAYTEPRPSATGYGEVRPRLCKNAMFLEIAKIFTT